MHTGFFAWSASNWGRRLVRSGLAAVALAGECGAATQPKTPPAIPHFSMQASCADAPDATACERIEGEARAKLPAAWARLSAEEKSMCEARARAASGSYIAALSCATNQ